WMVDVVYIRGPRGPIIGVRSVFRVSRKRARHVLVFKRYWFAPGALPIPLSKSLYLKMRLGSLPRTDVDPVRQMVGAFRAGPRIEGKNFEEYLTSLRHRMAAKRPVEGR